MTEEAVQSSEPTGETIDSTRPEVASQPDTSESTDTSSISEVTENTEVSTEESSEVSEEKPQEEAPQLYEIVVDGETKQVPLDELLKGYQLTSASNKRFQEAAQTKKEAEDEAAQVKALQEDLLKNPYEALRKANIPFEQIRKHYEDVVYQMLQLDQMSDAEKQALQEKQEYARTKAEYERLQKELAERTKADEERTFQAEVEKQQANYAKQINDAMSTGGVPNTPEAIQGVANILSTALNGGYELSVDDAVRQYKEESSSAIKNLLGGMSEDALLALIGEEKMNVIRRKDVESLKNPGLPGANTTKESAPTSEKVSASDFFESLRESTYRR